MDSKSAEWSVYEIDILINQVKTHLMLFPKLERLPEELWMATAVKLPEKSAQKCKEKWRYLKNSFIERHRSNKTIKWPYYQTLLFLRPFIYGVREAPQPSTSTASVYFQNSTMKKAPIPPDAKPFQKGLKRSKREDSCSKQHSDPKKRKSSIAALFERIEEDITKLPDDEQFDFEIQVMTIFRDKMKNVKKGPNV